MKKFILFCALSLLLVTGCGKVEVIKCTNEQESYGVSLKSDLSITLKDNNFKDLNMTINAVLPETYLSQKSLFVNSFKEQYKDFKDQYGVEPKVTETDNGVKIEMKMNAKQAKEFYETSDTTGKKVTTKTTKKEVIKEFESQGFTCK